MGDWQELLKEWGCIHDNLYRNIDILYENNIVYPEKDNIFRVFRECTYKNCKVVMLFQDPYHNGSATGIATATERDKVPVTLKNMFKEIKNEYGKCDVSPNLLSWCRQGVLMLNCALTVEKDSPASHLKIWNGWTNSFISGLSSSKDLVWVLVGKPSQNFSKYIQKGIVLNCVHPAAEAYSGGNAGFFGSDIFTRVNNNLHSKIKWYEDV